MTEGSLPRLSEIYREGNENFLGEVSSVEATDNTIETIAEPVVPLFSNEPVRLTELEVQNSVSGGWLTKDALINIRRTSGLPEPSEDQIAEAEKNTTEKTRTTLENPNDRQISPGFWLGRDE